ncbi:MAG TPA: T9SS type A sorting domain-containing protein, partial [Bacteroidia bacterium]|nr:T9SS type A sorting domain-containing protein [Bacteroidia bacterium]
VSGQEFGTFSTQVNYSHAAYINRGRARCETTNPLIITIGNYGVLPVQDRITLITSSNYIYSSSSVAPDLTNGDTLSWYGPVLNPMTSYSLGGALMFTAPAAMQNVTIQVIDSMFDLSGTFIDVYLDTYTYQVRCSYDPNDKHVSPAGVLAQHYTPINSELTYLINFQNTGNDTAYDVFIHDTLDSDLDLSTFEVLGSSHEVNVQRTTAGAVRFNFFNIMLPDSGADEPGSHGWVLYRISPNAGLADPTEITNTSYIVFDQNIPVITNTTLNTMTALQYPQANFTTADVTICETDCILFSNQSVSGTSYQWNFQGGSPASSTSASPGAICYNASGSSDVTLVTTNALGSDTLTQSAYINVAPAPGVFSVVQAGDSLIAPQGYYSYQWYYDNILINGSTSYFYIATLDGDYGIVVGNANGCQSGVNIPNVIIGVDDITSGKAISVYPNPTSGKFELSFTSNDNQSVTITVFDKVGKMVQSKVVQTVSGVNKIAMDEQNLAAGVYTIQLAGKSKVISKLLMINK